MSAASDVAPSQSPSGELRVEAGASSCLLFPGGRITHRDLWLGRLPTIRRDIEFWRDVADREKCVWASAWLRDVLAAVERFRQRAEREER